MGARLDNYIKTIKMRKFNLQEALSGKPIITRDGRKITEIHYLMTTTEDNTKLIAVVDGYVLGYSIDGRHNSPKLDSPSDLFMDEPVVEKWFNVYRHTLKGTEISVGEGYYTYEEAIKMGGRLDNYIKTIKIDNKPE